MIDIEPYISLESSADSRLARRIYETISEAGEPLSVCEIRDKIGAMPGSFGMNDSYHAKALDLLVEVGLVEEIVWCRERTGIRSWVEKRITYKGGRRG
jgi:hypothetical protein